MKRFWIVLSIAWLGLALIPQAVRSEGEAVNGYPNWSERVLLEWMNRGRADPQADLTGCPSGNCKDNMGSCYSPTAPRYFDDALLRSSRFHATHLFVNNYFDHPSHCTLVSNIATIFPSTCNGAATCSCTQGALVSDNTKWTNPFARIAQFGGSAGGEIIAAGYAGPDSTYYGWLYENAFAASCSIVGNPNPPFNSNGHRFEILKDGFGGMTGAGYVAGSGASYGTYSDMDIGTGPAHTSKIPSGSHYPQQAGSVDAWTNWYDAAGPSVHKINVDGVCTDMALLRGSQTNGAWHLSVGGVATGCHRYNFAFKDSAGKDVLYPTNGSLAIGNGGATCADFSSAAPPACPGFDRIFAHGFEP